MKYFWFIRLIGFSFYTFRTLVKISWYIGSEIWTILQGWQDLEQHCTVFLVWSLVTYCCSYLTCGKGFDAPQELGNILDGHLEAEGVRSKRQHLWLLEELTSSGLFCSHHSLKVREGGKRKGKETWKQMKREREKRFLQKNILQLFVWRYTSFAYQHQHLLLILSSVTSTNWLISNINREAGCKEVTPRLHWTNPTTCSLALASHLQTWQIQTWI